MKKVFILSTVTIVNLIFAIGGLSYEYIKKNDADASSILHSCSARIEYLQGEERQSLELTFMKNLTKGIGSVVIEGSFFINGIYEGSIYRQIDFTFTTNNNYHMFTSTNITTLKGNTTSDQTLLRILPPFFAVKGEKVHYSIQNISDKGSLFIIGKIPRFYCSNI